MVPPSKTYLFCVCCIVHLATSGSCPRRRRRGWVFTSKAQQGKLKSVRIKMPLCRMTPTRRRFLLPKVWGRDARPTQDNKHFNLKVRWSIFIWFILLDIWSAVCIENTPVIPACHKPKLVPTLLLQLLHWWSEKQFFYWK